MTRRKDPHPDRTRCQAGYLIDRRGQCWFCRREPGEHCRECKAREGKEDE